MTQTPRPTGVPGFDPTQIAQALRDAADQVRTSVDRKVGVRMGRGDVRAAVLALLHEKPMHGYQIIREIESRTAGAWKPSAGSVYPTLQMLADEGLVSTEHVNDRKVYSLTDEAAAEAEQAAASAPWEDPDCEPSGLGALSKAGLDLAQAVAQVARTGTAAQQERAVEELSAVRRRMYSILADD